MFASAMKSFLLLIWMGFLHFSQYRIHISASTIFYEENFLPEANDILFNLLDKKALPSLLLPAQSDFKKSFRSHENSFSPKLKTSLKDHHYLIPDRISHKFDHHHEHYDWDNFYNAPPMIQDMMEDGKMSKNSSSAMSSSMESFKRKHNLALLSIVLPLIAYTSLGPLLAAQIFAALAMNRPKRLLRRKRYIENSKIKSDKFGNREDLSSQLDASNIKDDILATYLTCKGLTSFQNRCLERLACESTRQSATVVSDDKMIITSMMVDIMRNRKLKTTLKRRLRNAAVFGRRNEGNCDIYPCSIDAL